jgi:cell wall-associated protease
VRRRALLVVLAVLVAVGIVRPVPASASASGSAPSGTREYSVHAVDVVPNDPNYPSQFGPPRVGAPAAWAETTGNASTVIAIVDSGVTPSYPDLYPRVLPGYDFVANDSDPSDENGHGTLVAHVAMATGNNGYAMAGYCWQCRILPVRVLDANGDGDTGKVASGIVWAVDHGANIINLSLAGNPGDGPGSLADAVGYAQSRGVLVVAAAGNGPAPDLTVPRYPAALPGVVSVGASDGQDAMYDFSFRGSWVQVTAPGCMFESDELASDNPCGTSFAAPVVSGILGLGHAEAPCASASVVDDSLYNTVTAVSGGTVNHGRVNADQYLAYLEAHARTRRMAGDSRITTAIDVSKHTIAHASTVVLARFDNYVDALAAAPLAAKLGGPVLLTPSNALDARVEGEIRRLGATDAVLAGGTTALSSALESHLQSIGIRTDRAAGQSRYETAWRLGQRIGGGGTVYVVAASGFADAVAVSGLAASTGSPILLTDKDQIPGPTASAISDLHPTRVVVVGGPAVVSDAVVNALHASRLAGNNRYETSKLIGDASVYAGVDPKHVWVATGTNWPDALAAGPAAAASHAVLLLADPSAGMVRSWLSGHASTSLAIAGGPVSISDPTACAMDANLQ